MSSLQPRPRTRTSTPPQNLSSGEASLPGGISFWSDEKQDVCMSHIGFDKRGQFENFLIEAYGVVDILYSLPFIFLLTEDEPRPDFPFNLGGATVFWRHVDEDYPFNLVGDVTFSGNPVLDVPITTTLEALDPLPEHFALHLAEHVFPDCVALTRVWDVLVIEFPKVPAEAYLRRIARLPFHFKNCSFQVRYHNGPLPNTELARPHLDPGVLFSNEFLDIPATPLTLLKSADQRPGDMYLIDSFVTGKQHLRGMGSRMVIGRRPSPSFPAQCVTHIQLLQGVYATSAGVIRKMQSCIRGGVSGALLLRSQERGTGRNVRELGQCGGIMHFADIQNRFDFAELAQYLVYADAFDPLIEAGWTVPSPTL